MSCQISATFTPVQTLCLLPFLWGPLYPLLRRLAFETLCSGVSSHPPLPYLRALGWHFITGIIYSHSLALKTFVPAAQLPDEGKRWVVLGCHTTITCNNLGSSQRQYKSLVSAGGDPHVEHRQRSP